VASLSETTFQAARRNGCYGGNSYTLQGHAAAPPLFPVPGAEISSGTDLARRAAEASADSHAAFARRTCAIPPLFDRDLRTR